MQTYFIYNDAYQRQATIQATESQMANIDLPIGWGFVKADS